MTLEEAGRSIGRQVTYRSHPAAASVEYGVITEVRSNWVFVRYASDEQAKATAARHLELVTS